MKSLLRSVLLAIALSSVVIARDDVVRRRKTLGFGFDHPHAKFVTDPVQLAAFQPTSFARQDPVQVAREFVEAQLMQDGQLSEDSTFIIRKDSYTDENTGVTHVYVRQLINGLEVTDGDINVNVHDGRVISYGDSFYRGDAPTPMTSPAHEASTGMYSPHHAQCLPLVNMRRSMMNVPKMQMEQTFLSADGPVSSDEEAIVSQAVQTSCIDAVSFWGVGSHLGEGVVDVRHAVLNFMLQATPNNGVRGDISNNYKSRFDSITSTFEQHAGGLHCEHYNYVEEQLHDVPDAVSPVKARLAYAQVPGDDGKTKLSLVWKLEVEMEDNWYEVAMTAHTPAKIVSVVDWASDSPMPLAPVPKPHGHPPATYNVFGWAVNDPSTGERGIYKEQFDKLASPIGWHSIPAANDPRSYGSLKKSGAINNHTDTWGNNVFAQENWEGRNSWENNYRPDAGESMVFNYTYDPQLTNSTDALDEAKKYINATVTQLFYTMNRIHDMYYRYGFDEVSGNFQQHNFGRGGGENDAVIANAQDGSGYNNANFMSPPDGQSGRCRMYLWNTAIPYRDGDLEAGIVIHEFSHGLSTRMTGGPMNSGCLGWGESGGMGEGWGDFLATTIRSTKNYSDYSMGGWAANRETGIRNFVYSLNMTVNPSTYKYLDKPGYWGVHPIGEVWAAILWMASNNLIEKHGFSDTLFPPEPLENGTIPSGDFYRPAQYTADGKQKPLIPAHGNTLMVQLVLNAMKLQQCRPSFFDARDAIIQADKVLTGGENFCELWKGFAVRGLGTDAVVKGRTPWGGGVRTDGFKVPARCEDHNEPDEPQVPLPSPPSPPDDDDDDEDWFRIFW